MKWNERAKGKTDSIDMSISNEMECACRRAWPIDGTQLDQCVRRIQSVVQDNRRHVTHQCNIGHIHARRHRCHKVAEHCRCTRVHKCRMNRKLRGAAWLVNPRFLMKQVVKLLHVSGFTRA